MKQLEMLNKLYIVVNGRLSSCSDKDFPRWLKLSQLLKNEIIELESKVQS